MWPNPQERADLLTFIEEILNGKLHFCAVSRKTETVISYKMEIAHPSKLLPVQS